MPSNQTNCNDCGCTPNPLDSGNWESESTARSAATSDANQREPNFSPSPTGECEIGFIDHIVKKHWKDATYDAGENLESNCKPEDIRWSIRGDAHGSTIDQNGLVTFGAPAQITILVECGDYGDIMDLIMVRVRVMYQNPDAIPGILTDITDQTLNVEVGNYIELEAQIEPSELAGFGTDYGWSISDTILKDYFEDATSYPVQHVLPSDYAQQFIKFHWIDHGSKGCSVSVHFDGLVLAAGAGFDVSRPVGSITGTLLEGPRVLINPSSNGVVTSPADVRFVRGGEFPTGKTCWCQMLNFTQFERRLNGVIVFESPSEGLTNGLDASFPYGGPLGPVDITTDHPYWESPAYDGTFNVISDAIVASMYLMYQSQQKNSRWVALRAINWKGEVTARYHTDISLWEMLAPPSSATVDNPDSDAIFPPNWVRIIFPDDHE